MQEEVLQSIISDYSTGHSLRKLRDKYRYSIGNLHYHLDKAGLLRKNNIVKCLRVYDTLAIGIFIGLWAGDGSKFRDGPSYTVKIHMNKKDVVLLEFIRDWILRLFAKKFRYVAEKETNRGLIVFSSKFIYNFLDDYLAYEDNKTLTVCLKDKLSFYSIDFLRGFVLGLTLSDGYIKERFVFTSISKRLAKNAFSILKIFGFEPCVYFHGPGRYGKHNQFRIVLNKEQTRLFKIFLQNAINSYGFDATLDQLKSYPQKPL